MPKKNLNSIDLAKFIGSILILTMHLEALGDIKYANFILEILARWGVPFFFISSSYLLFKKGSNHKLNKADLFHYVHRIGMLYICWCLINLPGIFYERLYHQNLLDIRVWTELSIRLFISNIFTGSWYLVSSIFSACMVFYLGTRINTRKIMGITSVFYLFCVLTSIYRGILPPGILGALRSVRFPLNLFTGCFFFSLGKYIAEEESHLLFILNKKRSLCIFLISYLIFVIEIYISKRLGIYYSTDIGLSTAAIGFSLFVFCLQTNFTLKNHRLLRKLSVIIYCCQGNVIVFHILLRNMGFSYFLNYIISLFFVALICIIILSLQKKKTKGFVHNLT